MLKVGAAKEIITPRVGGNLFGYDYDTISNKVNDDLTVIAMVFVDGNKRIMLISATLCEFSTDFALEVRQKVAERTGFDVSDIILSAIHTHSGPCVANMEGWGSVDRPYVDEIFIPNTLKAAERALAEIRPAVVGVSSVESKVGINRRQVGRGGDSFLGQNPWGLYDPNMTCIAVKDETGKGIVNIIHYGAHCTAAGKNQEISRDWAGIMMDCLERETGTITAFINGAEGDVGPRLTNGSTVGNMTYVYELGGVAAMDAIKAYRDIKTFLPVELKVSKGVVSLPYKPIISREEAEAELAEIGEKPRHNIERKRHTTLESIIEAYNSGSDIPTHKLLDQTVFSLGDIVIIPFPFEIFSEISLRFREFSDYRHTLCVSCSNGTNGYLPSQTELCRGGYEILVYQYDGVTTLAENTDTNILNENLRLMESLK